MFKWLKELFQGKDCQSVAELVKNFPTLDKLGWWIEQNIFYKIDGVSDEWKSSERTLKDRAGDCEDFANLCYDCLVALDYKPHILVMYEKRKAHAICAFKEWETARVWRYYDNGVLHTCTRLVFTLEDVAHYAMPKLIWWRETDTRGNTIHG